MFVLERWQPGAADPPFLNVGTGSIPLAQGLTSTVAEFVTGQPTARAALNCERPLMCDSGWAPAQ